MYFFIHSVDMAARHTTEIVSEMFDEKSVMELELETDTQTMIWNAKVSYSSSYSFILNYVKTNLKRNKYFVQNIYFFLKQI